MLRGDHAMRQPAYRWLVTGTTVNVLGSSIAPVAIAFAVLDVGGSTTQLGLVMAAYALADVAAVLGGGLLGDRLSRQLIMRAANTTAGLVQAFMAVSLISGWATVWLIAVAAAANGVLGSLAGPSTQAITAQTVPPEILRQAITLRRLAQNAASIAGFGAAGILVAWIGTGGALAIDAATFLIAAGCFTRIRVPSITAAPGRGRLIREAAEGLREVLRRSWLWAGIAMALVYHLFYGGAQGVLGPVVVGEHISRPAWGYALSAMMIGFVSGGLISLVWKPRRILLVGELFLTLTVCFPLAMALSDRLSLILTGAFLHGLGLEIFSVGWDLAIQENVPEQLLARVYSFDQLGSFLARPIGLALTGPLAALVGDRHWLLIVAGAMLTAEVVPFCVPQIRQLQRRPVSVELTREASTR